MITQIEANPYRRFEKLGVDLDRYQVLVGRNGAGKSTLLDIPVLIGKMLETRSIEKAFFGERNRLAPRASTAEDLLFARTGDWFSLAVEVRLGGKKRGGPIFKGVFTAISQAAFDRCVELGFIALRTALQMWYPPTGGAA